jgi:GNAT superfamily N-acetyltransferase
LLVAGTCPVLSVAIILAEATMNFSIRQAELPDAAVVAEFNSRLAQESEGKKLDPAKLLPGVQALLQDAHKGVYFLALDDAARPLGQIMYTYEWSDWRNGWFWWLQSVFVVPQHRGCGVFRQLFDHVVSQARRQGNVIGLRLYVENNNTRAHEVYGRCGFEKAGYFVLERPLKESLSP